MTKRKVAIVTDSTANLPPELVAKHEIHVIPLNLHWDEESLLDNVDITPAAFYARLENSSSVPTTSQPSAGRFFQFFSEVAESADSIVGIFLSSDLSGTFASAHAAVDMMGDYPMKIVDSRSVSLGLGLMVLEAARLAEAGKGYQQIAEVIEAMVPHVHVRFVVDTLEYLHRGGRIGGGKRLIGSMLSIKPLLGVHEGTVEALASVRTKRKAVDRLLEIAQEETEGAQALHMGVIHAAAEDEGRALAERVRERFKPVELVENELTPVIGTHGGPGTVGVCYYDEAALPRRS
ncbi:MAG: DegV family protein [Candidatus Promineifilaceae bacterium]|nr:DegV family protein [Candidatus Promineifilaceae bacterium]